MTDPHGTTHVREVFGRDIVETGQSIADYAFEGSPHKHDPERGQKLLAYGAASRFFVAYAGGTPQASSILYAMSQNVRGKVLPMGGIGEVGSLPAGRRQGHVRRMLIRLFEEMRSDGHVISALYPFRESFYERLGYASTLRTRFVTFDPEPLSSLARVEKTGYVTQQPMSEVWETWRTLLEQMQRSRHGFSLRDVSSDIRRRDENTAWVALAHDERGQITGSMTFRITGYGKRLDVKYFYPTTTEARYLLLDWIGRHVDQVSEVSIEVAADDYADVWIRDLRAQTSTVNAYPWPGPMMRIISVADLGGIGAGEGELAVEIIDELAPWNTGVYTFAGRDGNLKVTAGGKASATLSIHALSALVFSGHDPAAFVYRGWGNPNPAAQEILRAIFSPTIPFLHEEF